MPRIVILDDEHLVAESAAEVLSCHFGHAVDAFSDPVETLESVVNGEAPDVLLVDVSMPKQRGTEVATIVHSFAPNCRILLFTGIDSVEVNEFLACNPWCGLITKPVGPADLCERVGQLLSAT